MIWLLLSIAAALQLALSPAERYVQAPLVIVGEVTSSETRFEPGAEGYIETRVWIAVEGSPRGDATADTLEVKIAGGQIGRLSTWTEDEPVLREDHRYLLHLVRDFEGNWRVYGGEPGAVTLENASAPWAPSLAQVLREVSR